MNTERALSGIRILAFNATSAASPSTSRSPRAGRSSPPLAGQHTEELLSEILGLSKDDVAALRGRGIVGG